MIYLPALLGAEDAARYLGISPSKLRGLPLKRRVLDGKRLYDRRDLDAFADSLPYEGEGAPVDEADRWLRDHG